MPCEGGFQAFVPISRRRQWRQLCFLSFSSGGRFAALIGDKHGGNEHAHLYNNPSGMALLLGLFGTCVAVDTKTSIIVQRKTDKFLQPRVSESSYQEQSDQKLYP